MYQINKLIYKVNGEIEAYHGFRALNELKKIISNKYSFKYLNNSYLFTFDELCEETVKEFVIEFGWYDHFIKYEYYFQVRSTPVDDGKLSNKILVEREGLKLNGFSLFERIGSNEGCFVITNGKYRKLNQFMDDILIISFDKYIENTESFVAALNELPESWDEIEFTNPFKISFDENKIPPDIKFQLIKVYKPMFNSCMDEIDTSEPSKSVDQNKNSINLGKVVKHGNGYSMYYDDKAEKKSKLNNFSFGEKLILLFFCSLIGLLVGLTIDHVISFFKPYFK